MKLPSVVHPRQIKAGAFTFEVVSYSALTDQQAANVVKMYLRSHRMKKKDAGLVHQIVTTIDQGSAGMFGA